MEVNQAGQWFLDAAQLSACLHQGLGYALKQSPLPSLRFYPPGALQSAPQRGPVPLHGLYRIGVPALSRRFASRST